MQNRFLRDPVRVIIYDPIAQLARRTFVFLGDVPKSIITAASRAEHEPLREFYGANYKTKLGITSPARAGGADSEDPDDDIADLLEQLDRVKPAAVAAPARTNFSAGTEYVTDVHLFPDDKFSEVKEKIYLATGLPTYRQHLFYSGRESTQTTYQIYANGLYSTDIRNIASENQIHGVPIDKSLYDHRDAVRVESYDNFQILDTSLTDGVIYVVDLAQFTGKIQSQLVDLLSDTYQFELFYYGFVVKYWPQLTTECFHDYVRNESELQYKYPELAKNKLALQSSYRAEREIITEDYKNAMRAASYIQSTGASVAITQMVATVAGNATLNTRGLFDNLTTSRLIPEIHAYFEVDNKR